MPALSFCFFDEGVSPALLVPLAMVNECSLYLLEAGADPTIRTPRWNSFSTIVCRAATKVIRSFSHSALYSNPEKESLVTLLNHSFEFLVSSSEVDLCDLVMGCFQTAMWTFDAVASLLQLSGSKLPVQNLDGTLFKALLGSLRENKTGILKVLILLIEAGADLTTDGPLVSKIACNPQTTYKTSAVFSIRRDCVGFINHQLGLRRIWAEALTACGYDAEEYILQSTRFEELSESDGEEAENPSEITSDEDDTSTTEDQIISPDLNQEAFHNEEDLLGTDSLCQSGLTLGEDNISTAEDQTDFPSLDQEDFHNEDALGTDSLYQGGTIWCENEIFTAEDQINSPDLNLEAFYSEGAPATDATYQPLDFPPYNASDDWAFLEDDALVWRD